MIFISKQVAQDHGHADDRGYLRGVWVTWQSDALPQVHIVDVYDDETDALRAAVIDNTSVAFVPYGQGRGYIHWAAEVVIGPAADPQ